MRGWRSHEGWRAKLRTASSGWGFYKGPDIDPWSIEARRKEPFPPEVPPAQARVANVVRIDCGREPARPSLSTIRARKRAA